MPQFDGVSITLGGETFVVPPLNFRALRTIGPKLVQLSQIQGIPTEEEITAMVDILLAAFQRNYPDLTAERLEGLLDLTNVLPTIQAVMEASGFNSPKVKAVETD